MHRLRLEGMGEAELRRVCANLEAIAENLRAELDEARDGRRRAELAVSFWLVSFERVTDAVGELMRAAASGDAVTATALKAILDREQCEEYTDEAKLTKRTAAELEAMDVETIVYLGDMPGRAVKRVRGGWRRFHQGSFRAFGRTITSAQLEQLGAWR